MESLPPDAGNILLPLARLAIAHALGRQPAPAAADAAWLSAPGASYITITHAAQMRGRTGTLEPQRPLGTDVAANAVDAALRDPCFSPMTLADLDRAVIEVAVLSDFEFITTADEKSALSRLRVGVDGVIFRYGRHRSTFLPEVWGQYADPVEFLAHLKYKAGLPPDFWNADVSVQRYTVARWVESPVS